MDVNVQAGNWYVVEGDAGDTVTNPLTGRVIATVEDGKQTSFLATTPYVVTSSDSVDVHKVNFKSAPAKLKALGLLGGGTPTLIAGYLETAFLESEGKSTITLPTCEYAKDVEIDFKPTKAAGYRPRIFVVQQVGSYRQGIEVYNTKYALLWGGTDTWMRTTNEVYNVNKRLKMRMDAKNKKIYINDVEVSYSNLFVVSGASIDVNFTLFVDSTICIFGSKIVFSDSSYEFVPALDANGKPCLYDLVSKQAFYNSGSQEFVVGLTVEQACKLSKLPNSGGVLTISLPSSIVSGDTVTDSAVNAALSTARSKGWNITVQTYDAEATASASTFGLRRIWVRKTADENGSYVDADEKRWTVEWCVKMYTTDDSTPDQHGYELFRSVESACEFWGLTPYVDPAFEDDFLTETENNEQE